MMRAMNGPFFTEMSRMALRSDPDGTLADDDASFSRHLQRNCSYLIPSEAVLARHDHGGITRGNNYFRSRIQMSASALAAP